VWFAAVTLPMWCLYGALLIPFVVADARRPRADDPSRDAADLLMYVPFMVAVPQLVYHYALVALLPVIPAAAVLWARESSARHRALLMLALTGLAVSQVQAYALERVTGLSVAHLVPTAGLLTVLVASWLHAVLPRRARGEGTLESSRG
jgi:hypothetical protein